MKYVLLLRPYVYYCKEAEHFFHGSSREKMFSIKVTTP